jgi:hypothetical protein
MGEGGRTLKPYKPWDFCKSIDCDALSVVHKDERMKKVYCHKCYAYQFHQYLRDHDQILEEGSSLARVIQATNQRAEELEQLRKENEDYVIELGLTRSELEHHKKALELSCQFAINSKEAIKMFLDQASLVLHGKQAFYQSKKAE